MPRSDFDLFLAAISVAWLKGAGGADEESLNRLRTLLVTGYRERDAQA